MKKILMSALTIALLLPSMLMADGPYEATTESLSKHNATPEWFRDAKFGIYFHWGVYSVPAYGNEWYPRAMYDTSSHYHKNHVENWGKPDEFPYSKFVPMFKAEKFDAEEWAQLFKESGARFAGPVAEHHDGFAMWDTDLTPWNSMDRGPKRDITGELEKAIRKRDMKFVTTFHHARNSLWMKDPDKFQKKRGWSGHYGTAKENYPSVLEDKDEAFLYGDMPRDEFHAMWKGKLLEVIDKYDPDMIWFDAWLYEIDDQTENEFLAYYFNHAAKKGKDVVVTCKNLDLPRSIAVQDFEKGRTSELTDYAWLTDDTLSWGSWSYTENLELKKVSTVIHTLADIVSKNGQLLLNISPKANGIIPENQKEALREIGRWLKTNGEAIFDTRPWLSFGEGPTRITKGGHFLGKIFYTNRDIRYTRSKDGQTLYAIVLGPPAEGKITLTHVTAESAPTVTMLGGSKLKASLNAEGHVVVSVQPGALADACAYVMKIEGGATLHADAAFDSPDATTLGADKAALQGDGIRVETITESPNLGHWDNASDKAHWLINIRTPGTYRVRGTFATGGADCSAAISIGEKTRSFAIPATETFKTPRVVPIGEFHFDSPGVYHVIVHASSEETWRAINLWNIQIVKPRTSRSR